MLAGAGLLLCCASVNLSGAGLWQFWAALGCGAGGTLLSQAAFQAGPLGGSLGAMMAIDPVVGVGLGMVVFGEPFATDDTAPVRLVGLAITLVGVWLLAMVQRAPTATLPPLRTPTATPGR